MYTMWLSDVRFNRLADVCISDGEVSAVGFFVPFFLKQANLGLAFIGLVITIVSWTFGIFLSR